MYVKFYLGFYIETLISSKLEPVLYNVPTIPGSDVGKLAIFY